MAPESSLAPPAWGGLSKEMPACESGAGSSPDTKFARPLTLDVQPPELQERDAWGSSHLAHGLLFQPGQTETGFPQPFLSPGFLLWGLLGSVLGGGETEPTQPCEGASPG